MELTAKPVYYFEGKHLFKKDVKTEAVCGLGNIIDEIFPDATPKQKLKALEKLASKDVRSRLHYYTTIRIETEKDCYTNVLDI